MKTYIDNFAHDNLPSKELLPQYSFLDLPQFKRPENLNCVENLLDIHIKNGNGNAICIRTFEETWTYQDVYEKANQIAHVLIDNLGLVSGNRVLLRSANNPMMVACWFAVIKAGGIVVATMPLLRAKELSTIIDCAEISIALSDSDLADELNVVASPFLKQKCFYNNDDLEQLMQTKPKTFQNYASKSNDVCIIGFTSGTTGLPKMTAHFHK
ncbi:AMP-binding protein, partial [Flavobacterium sp. J27]|uniref:AMP-binding protein n=1 Tax=Flavobacterium sp. J27 TaxID=2060419 RepID=UPI001F10C87F